MMVGRYYLHPRTSDLLRKHIHAVLRELRTARLHRESVIRIQPK